jgi:hypothetical protein
VPGVTGKTSAQWRRGISEDSTQSQNRSADSEAVSQPNVIV